MESVIRTLIVGIFLLPITFSLFSMLNVKIEGFNVFVISNVNLVLAVIIVLLHEIRMNTKQLIELNKNNKNL